MHVNAPARIAVDRCLVVGRLLLLGHPLPHCQTTVTHAADVWMWVWVQSSVFPTPKLLGGTSAAAGEEQAAGQCAMSDTEEGASCAAAAEEEAGEQVEVEVEVEAEQQGGSWSPPVELSAEEQAARRERSQTLEMEIRQMLQELREQHPPSPGWAAPRMASGAA